MLKGKHPHELNGQQESGQVHPARLENKGTRLEGDSMQMRRNISYREDTVRGTDPQWEGLTSSVRKRKIKAFQGEAKCKLITNLPGQRPGERTCPNRSRPRSLLLGPTCS